MFLLVGYICIHVFYIYFLHSKRLKGIGETFYSNETITQCNIYLHFTHISLALQVIIINPIN